ncbi:MAG: hypothetical protein ACYC54_08920 [Sedimentisphaerales bacterium]
MPVLDGCVKFYTSQSDSGFYLVYFNTSTTCRSCQYKGCLMESGDHAGQVRVIINDGTCNDTYYACIDWDNGGYFKLTIPDSCCQVWFDDCDNSQGDYGCGWEAGFVPNQIVVHIKGIRRCSDDTIIEELEDKCFCLSQNNDPGYGCDNMSWAGGRAKAKQYEDYLAANVQSGDQFILTVTNADNSDSHTITYTATSTNRDTVAQQLVSLWNASTNPLCTPVTATYSSSRAWFEADVAGAPFFITPSTINGGSADTQTLVKRVNRENYGIPYGDTYYGICIGAGQSPFGGVQIEINFSTLEECNYGIYGTAFSYSVPNHGVQFCQQYPDYCSRCPPCRAGDYSLPCPPNSYSNCLVYGCCHDYRGNLISPQGYGGTVTLIDVTGVIEPEIWSAGTSYTTQSVVVSNSDGKKYICIQDHTSTTSDEPPLGINWEDYWKLMECL